MSRGDYTVESCKRPGEKGKCLSQGADGRNTDGGVGWEDLRRDFQVTLSCSQRPYCMQPRNPDSGARRLGPEFYFCMAWASYVTSLGLVSTYLPHKVILRIK